MSESRDTAELVRVIKESSLAADRGAAALRLGVLGDVAAVDPLLDALRDPDPGVRAMAVWALDEINPTQRE